MTNRKYYYIEHERDRSIMEAVEGKVIQVNPNLLTFTKEIEDWEFGKGVMNGSIFWYFAPHGNTALGTDDTGQQWSIAMHADMDGKPQKCVEFSDTGWEWENHPLSHDYKFEDSMFNRWGNS